jgi:hypothetical protein
LWYNDIRTEEVMVGGAVAHPTANSEPCLTVSHHTAPQPWGLCHRHLPPVHPVVTVSVQEHQVGVAVIPPVLVEMVNLQRILCGKVQSTITALPSLSL